MMVLRLGFVPAAALVVLTSAGAANAQYYPAETAAEPTYAAPAEEAQVPAAYDPYASTSKPGAPAGAQPMIMAPPAGAAAGTQQPPGAVANAPYANPATQPAGYPPGAYSGQPPAGMASPYGSQSYGSAAQSQAAVGAPPAAVGTQPQNLDNNYGTNGSSVAMLPPEDQPETGPRKALPANLQRQVVDYVTTQPPGTIIIDTPNTYLYYVLPGGKAERYGIGVGREGFTWAGTEKISRKAEWADWRPPAEMIERQPYLPRFMAGGPGNPLGARTMYLGGTIYRIHGTNQPSTIGQFMSSGCIRMLNEDVEALYDKVKVGTKVVVLPGNAPAKTAEASAAEAAPVQQVSAPAAAGVAVR